MYKTQKIVGLDVIEVPGTPNGGAFVLLHGYGADANDLAPLSHVLKVPHGMGWIIPHGPLRVPVGPGFEGRAWGPINLEEWQRAMAEGRPRDLSKDRPPELFTSSQKILELLEHLSIPVEKTVFGGFSQGAMLATHLALSAPVAPKGLVIFSGALINEGEWAQLAPKRKGLNYFQCHGTTDEILSHAGALKLNQLLSQAGLKGEFHSFEGGHDIPQSALENTQEFLIKLFPETNQWQEEK